MKDQNFFEEDWDTAVILDAARFDAFKQAYTEFIEGDLEKRRSNASATPEWVHRNFSGRHNITWLSANPFINSINAPLSESGPVSYDTTPSRHVTEIKDLWRTEWSPQHGTVRPEKVYEAWKQTDSGGKTVVHFMQPHAPFIGKGKSRINNSLRKNFSGGGGLKALSPVIERLEDTETAMKLGMYSNLDLKHLAEALRNGSRETLMRYHRENLETALEYASKVVEESDGRTIVTSDHGEAFGEQGVWGHHIEKHIPPLVEVPWLEAYDSS